MMKILWMVALLLMPLVSMAETQNYDLNENKYLLGPGDVVRVTVYDHPDLDTEAQLTSEGDLSFPLIGSVNLQGKTFDSAAKQISDKLQKGGFILKPNVNVFILQYKSQRIAVVGEVNRPGRYMLDSPTDLVAAIAQAGGISVNGGDTVILVSQRKRKEFRLSELAAEGGELQLGIPVANGDVLYVPRAQQFYVYGEVNRPGNYRLERGMTVMQAISVAGGFNPRASHKNINVFRAGTAEGQEKVALSLTDAVHVNDTIYIEESLF
ncbi:SLBB domain-containing protein [Chitinolyticbacter albus]|uniref:SLBB domain-containing protein n=1 Tax=Chitinolyticbacter albus TaxID=2961951 RepID=UPI00210CECDD|nr:SLBB domain-containing protein [Chitinolyticbacter albus]